MGKLKEHVSCKNVELLSEEVQEVMNRIPSAIVRWGMTVMAIIVTGLLIVAAYLPWPESVVVPFEGNLYGSKAVVRTALQSEVVRYLLHTDTKHSITLYSPMFSYDNSKNGISGIINAVSVESNTSDGYTTQLNIEIHDVNNSRDIINTFSGNILLVVSEKTLFQRISEQIRKF